MKYKLFFLTTIILLFVNCLTNNNKPESIWILVSEYLYHNKGSDTTLSSYHLHEYDNKNLKIKEELYDYNDSILQITTFQNNTEKNVSVYSNENISINAADCGILEYDSNGNIVKDSSMYLNGNDTLGHHTINYEYDNNGNTVRKYGIYYALTLPPFDDHYENEFDSGNRLIKQTAYNHYGYGIDSIFHKISTYEYDQNGNNTVKNDTLSGSNGYKIRIYEYEKR